MLMSLSPRVAQAIVDRLDDLGTGERLLISPAIYRELIKPAKQTLYR
jgi:hypothetical protein